MTDVPRRFGRLLLAAALLGAAPAHGASPAVPELADLQADGARAARAGKPLVLFFSMPGCAYCETVRRNYLAPLLRDGAAPVLVREAQLTGEGRVFGADGRATTPRELARGYGVKVAPTLLFVDGGGAPLAAPIVGGDAAGMYGAYLDNAIEESVRLLAARRGAR